MYSTHSATEGQDETGTHTDAGASQQDDKRKDDKTRDDSDVAQRAQALNLSVAHYQMLSQDSAISDDVIRQRGYHTARHKSYLKDLGFSDRQCCVPALVVPVHSVTGEIALHQIRPDSPRAGSDGKLRKYDTPPKVRMALDVHPSMRAQVGN